MSVHGARRTHKWHLLCEFNLASICKRQIRFVHLRITCVDKLTRSQEKTDEVLIKYNAYEGIDNLAEAVEEAKKAAAAVRSNTSKRRSSTSASVQDVAKGKDAWRSELAPRTAVHAVTVPLLEAERLRLERDLAEVGRLGLVY